MAEMKKITINGKEYTVEDSDSVSYGESQQLTEEQKARARKNIGAAYDDAFVKTVNGHAPDENGKVNIIDDTQMGADAWSGRKIAVDKASAIVEQASGEQLSLNDSAEAPLVGLALYGKTTQRTTTGKNLLDDSILHGISGITESNGVFSGTVGTFYAGTKDGKLSPETFAEGQQYVFSLYAKKSDAASTPYTVIKYTDGTQSGANITSTSAFERYVAVSTPGKTVQSVYLGYGDGGADTLYVKDIQLELGTKVTDYEPYTGGKPSPSPDYPQELESVGESGNIGVTVAGKNLLGRDNTNITDGATLNGITVTANSDGTFTINGTCSAAFVATIGEVTLAAGTYVYSQYNGSMLSIGYQLYALNAGGELGKFFGQVDTDYPSLTFTLTETTKVRARIFVNVNATHENFTPKVQIECGKTKTPYEPYVGSTLTAQTPNGLPGIPVESGGNYTDANGQQWICNEVDLKRGVLVKRTATVDLGSLTWYYNQSTGRFASSKLSPASKLKAAGVCTHLSVASKDYRSLGDNEMVVFDRAFSSSPVCIVRCDGLTDSTVFQEKMRGATLLYELEQPIETPLSAEELAEYAALHTKYPNTTVFNDAGAGVALSYVVDTKTYIDNKFAELAAAMMNS